jgi:hypothetical protein
MMDRCSRAPSDRIRQIPIAETDIANEIAVRLAVGFDGATG